MLTRSARGWPVAGLALALAALTSCTSAHSKAAARSANLTFRARQLPYAQGIDLNGEWQSQGWIFYLSEARGHVAFVGMNGLGEDPAHIGYGNTHVFWGTVTGDVISGAWVDLPRGERDNAYPLSVTFKVVGSPGGGTELDMTSSEGSNYGNSVLTPCTDPSAPTQG